MNTDELSKPEAAALLHAKRVLQLLIADNYSKLFDEICQKLKISEDDFYDHVDQIHHMCTQVLEK
jgi:phage anti-repressor protein